MRDRFRAFWIHLLISAAVLGVLFFIIFWFWYPAPYFQVKGAAGIILVLIGVDLVAGPLLTFLVYNREKKSLKFDLSVIVLIQLVALVYGTHAIWSERPYFNVFLLDRYNVLAAKDVDFAQIDDPRFLEKPWRGPLMLVARMPTDPAELSRLNDEVMFQGLPDLDRRPDYWQPYGEQVETVMLTAETVTALKEQRPQAVADIDRAIQRSGLQESALVFVPIIGRNGDFAVIVERQTGRILDAVAVNPWLSGR